MSGQKRNEMTKKKYLLWYTLVFTVFGICTLFVFVLRGKSFVWDQDGGPQYLPYLAYMGNYLRDFASRALHGDFTIKMFDFTIGLGDDVGCVIRAHPLDFLSIFVPEAYTEILYNAIVILRLYLGGLAFSAFCMLFRKPSLHMITGSMIYVFCGHALMFGLRHPTFLSAFIVLPLLLLSAERMMRKRGLGGYCLFALMVFLGFMSNYYFMYMCTIVLLTFILLRFPIHYQEKRVSAFIILFFRMGSAFLLGAGMAMATLLPIISSLTSSARLAEQSTPDNLLYYDNLKRYYRWFLDIIEPYRGIGDSTHMNFAAPVLPALFLVFASDRKKRLGTLKLGLLLALVCMLIPFGGYAMAGFSNVNNRWMFAMAMLAALAFVFCGEEVFTCSGRKLAGMLAVCVVYAGLAVYDFVTGGNRYGMMGMGLLLLTLVYIAAVRKTAALKAVAAPGLLAVVLICCTVNGWIFFSEDFGNEAAEFLDSGTGLALTCDSEFQAITAIEDEDFWRVDSNLITSNRENYSILLNYRGSSMYNSVLNGSVTYGLLSLGSNGLPSIHRIQGLDGRPGAEALANEKYYFTTVDGEQHAPYGYVYCPEYSTQDNAIYRNEYPVEFGYTYDTLISRSDYDAMNEAEREMIMMDAVVVDDEKAKTLSSDLTKISSSTEEILTESLSLPESGNGVERKDYGYRVKESGGSVSVSYQKRAGYTCYLKLIGFTQSKNYSFVDVMTTDLRTQITMRGIDMLYSTNKEDYIVNLGFDSEDAEDTIELYFYDRGKYTLSGIELLYIPMENYTEKVEKLNADALENTEFSINTISGTVTNEKAQMMVFSIPFSKGWTAEVDGQSEELLQVNVSYTGLYLAPGEHTVTLTYTSPGGSAGRRIALVSWILCAGLLVTGVLRKKRGAASAAPSAKI